MKKRNNNVLSSFDIIKYSDQFDEVGFGCDYLRLVYKDSIDKFEYYLDLLDFDNTNFGVVEIKGFNISYQKIPTSIGYGLHFSIDYSGTSVPIFQYVKFNKQTKDLIGYYGKVDIYSSFFRLVDIGYLEKNFVNTYLIGLTDENPLITRYDFRIDYFSKYRSVNIPTPESVLKISTQSKVEIFRKGDYLTNWGVGSKDSGKYYLRLYDKKLDTDRKGKRVLFTDYLCYKSVHRYEVQFQSAFCRGFYLSDLIKLEDKIYTVLDVSDLFEGSQFYSYDSTKEINDYNKGSHIQRFTNQTKKFVNAGYNPFVLMYDTLVNLYGIESAEEYFTEFLSVYFNPKINHEKE